MSSGTTTPGEESSERDDESDYEFNADGQEEYYNFLQEMGCEFQPHSEEEDDNDNETKELQEPAVDGEEHFFNAEEDEDE